MQRARRLHRRTTWLALVAMVLWSLAPAVARSLQWSGLTVGWLNVCSVSAPVSTTATTAINAQTADDDLPAGPLDQHQKHCPFCGAHFGAAPLPSAFAARLAVPQPGFERPRLFAQSHSSLFAWAAPPPRGPPAPLA